MKEHAVQTVLITPRLLNLEQAAAYLGGVSAWTVRSWVRDGFLAPVKMPAVRQSDDRGRRQGENNRRLLFDRQDLDAFIDSRRGV